MEEEVLVFPADLLDRLGPFTGFRSRVDDYLPEILSPKNLSYLRRSLAEEDPSFKQLIPYAVLKVGDLVYCYGRGKKGGESRLHSKLSLGVGGHICKEDGDEGSAAYEKGFARELEEELDIRSHYRSKIVGIVYDPSTPVGEVHVGIVHLLELESPDVIARDPSLADADFLSLDDIVSLKPRFETWSQFVIDHVLLTSTAAHARA
ncbi:phosphoesterase [bacterium]|nr:phosphoesterase [bacterium]